MKFSNKLLLPALAMSLITGSAFAAKPESQLNQLENQVPVQPVLIQPFNDRAPEAIHLTSALMAGFFALHQDLNEPSIPKVIFCAGMGYFFSKWFDNNVMN